MKILLIEDDKNLCQNIKEQLTKESYIVDACTSGEDGLIYALNIDNGYDIALIDRMLPVIDGLTILKAMRKKQIPIPVIMITGMSQLQDKIDGLDSGADDYLVKPFHLSELSARIRALTRRPAVYSEKSSLQYQDLSLDLARQELSCNGKTLPLTPKEFHLLCVLLEKPDTLHTRELLMQKVWETNADIEQGNVDNYVYFLRKRLRTLKSKCSITAVYGSGYMLEVSHDT
jgi:DNA-binding response OmpR family regulator